MTKYNLSKMLQDYEHGSHLFTDFDYRDQIAYTDLRNPAGLLPEEKQSEYGYELMLDKETIVQDPLNKYEPNSMGYRSPEFGPVDFVFAGCSMTYGIGVPEETIWGVQVAKKLGLSHANLGTPAQSAYYAIQSVYAYIRKYGKPKKVALLLPELSRMLVPSSPAFMLPRADAGKKKLSGKSTLAFISTADWKRDQTVDTKKRPALHKFPMVMEEVLYPEFSYFYTLQHLNAFEMYCEAADIDLVWATWSEQNQEMFESLKENRPEYFKNFIPLGAIENDCHQEYEDQYEHCFHIGGDIVLDRPEIMPHVGVHSHIHWADSYIEGFTKGE